MSVGTMMRDQDVQDVPIQELLGLVLDMGASDLHLTAGALPTFRVHGDLQALPQYSRMAPEPLRRMVYSILTQKQREKLEQELELDFSYSLPGRARFRVNVYFQRASIGAAFRLTPSSIPSLDDLGLPGHIRQFTRLPR